MEPNNHPNRPFFKFLWNWLIGTFSLAISLSVVATIWVSRGGGFSLSTTRKLPQNRLTEYVLLLKTKDPSLLNTNTQDLVEPHPLYQVKMKRKRGTPVSYNVASRPFPLKNVGDPLPGYAATRDDGTWREADSLFSVDFLFTKKTQNASDTPESIIEENLLERLSDRSRRPGTADSSAFYAFLLETTLVEHRLLENRSDPLPVSAGDRNGTTHIADSCVTFLFFGDSAVFGFETRSSIVFVPDQAQPQSRAQKRKKPLWMIQSERKQLQRRNYKWLRPEEPDACYYRPFKKTTSVSLENGSAGGSLRPLKGSLRPFRGSVRGYGADRDGTTHGTDFWDFFDTEIDEDHSRISHISEFEISIHTMDLKKLHIERQRYLSLIHDGEQIFNSTEKRSLLLEKGAVIRHENGGRKKLMKIPFSNEEEIQVHPKSESWEWEILTVQKPILASSALFQAKAKQIEKEISIKEQLPRLEHAEKDGPRIRDREKKTGAALLRYKKDPRKRELSSSYQKLKEPVGGQKPYPWRQLEDVSYYGSFKKIKAGKKKPSSAFQRTRTNPLLLDFSHNNDLFDVTEESQ